MSGTNKFTFEGLPELRALLQKLPAELTVEAGREVEAAANGAAATVKGIYGQHVVTGHLRDGLTVTHQRTPLGSKSILCSKSPLAWLFDNGSRTRQYITVNGKKHLTGRMPPMHIFDKTASRARHRMHEQLKAMLERHGAKVTGDAG